MKALKYVAIGLVAILLSALIVAYIIWLGYPKKYVDIFVLDKTVKDFDRTQHKSLFWILNNDRFVKKNGISTTYMCSEMFYNPE